jgi:hypothetical protein
MEEGRRLLVTAVDGLYMRRRKWARMGPRHVGSATGGEPVGRGQHCAPVACEACVRWLIGGDLDLFKQPGRSCSTGSAQHPGKI